MQRKHTGRSVKRGFTLVELVIVVGILVILAGLLLQNLDVFKLKANKGTAAANMADMSNVIRQYFAQYTVYPDRFDSLMDGSGSLWTAAAIGDDGLDSELPGGPIPNSPAKLTTITLDNDGYLRSLNRMGITTVLDLDATSTAAPSNRFTVPRVLANGDTVATINPADDDGKEIIDHLYPQQADPDNPVVPTGKMLVVMGIGPKNTMVGDTVQEVPLYPNRDVTHTYGRFLAVFEADDGGSPAVLKTVIGADGDMISGEIAEYHEH